MITVRDAKVLCCSTCGAAIQVVTPKAWETLGRVLEVLERSGSRPTCLPCKYPSLVDITPTDYGMRAVQILAGLDSMCREAMDGLPQ